MTATLNNTATAIVGVLYKHALFKNIFCFLFVTVISICLVLNIVVIS